MSNEDLCYELMSATHGLMFVLGFAIAQWLAICIYTALALFHRKRRRRSRR